MTPLPSIAELTRLRRDIVFSETLQRHELTFHTTWGLFSPREIDAGSRLLLEHIEVDEGTHSLDVGCGYGALGLTLAAMSPKGTATLIDKDFVAVEYCRRNAVANGLENTEIFLSNGLNQVEQDSFDLVVTNLPAKSGKELYTLMFCDVYSKLQPGGRFYIVTINGLRQFVKRNFVEIFGNYKKLKQGPVYTVAMAVRE